MKYQVGDKVICTKEINSYPFKAIKGAEYKIEEIDENPNCPIGIKIEYGDIVYCNEELQCEIGGEFKIIEKESKLSNRYSIQNTKAWRINSNNDISYLIEIGQVISLTLKNGVVIQGIVHNCWNNHIEIISNGLRDVLIEDIVNIQF